MDAEIPFTIDDIFKVLRERLPGVKIERLTVKWPADDDNLWYIRTRGSSEVQVECSPEGRGPFLIEGDSSGQRLETADAGEVVDTILRWLGSA